MDYRIARSKTAPSLGDTPVLPLEALLLAAPSEQLSPVSFSYDSYYTIFVSSLL